MREPSKGVGVANWLVSKTSGFLDARLTRRSFVSRATLVGTAVAATGCSVITQPGSPYIRIAECPPYTLCHDGYTEFCCVINNGVNACPPNTISAGWWRADYSVFCNGTRYYIDCNEVCCGPVRGDGFCASCHGCECAAGCNTRKVHCNYFRYGQCNQLLAHVGPIACRMVTCVPPYQLNIGCTASGAVDNSTAGHYADCSKYAPPPPAPPLPMVSLGPAIGGASVLGAGAPVVFARLDDTHVWERRFIAGTWADWAEVSGPATSGGSAVAPASGQVMMFVRREDNAVWVHRSTGGAWQATNLGGSLTSDPFAIVHLGQVYVFVRGSNYGYWWRRFDGTSWSPFAQLWGIGTSAPVAVTRNSVLYVFARLGDGAIWYGALSNGSWFGPTSLGGQISSGPAAGTLGSNAFVFGRSSDDALWYRRLSGSTWSPWASLGGDLQSDPVAVTVESSMYVIARFDDSSLWYLRTDNGTTWDPWVPIGTPPVMSDPTVTVDGSTLHVFASWAKTRLGHAAFNGTTWTEWEDLGGQLALVRGS